MKALLTELGMSKRWIAPWAESGSKRAIYHCISRIVDRRLVLGNLEREHFRMLMRMYEKFSGCRILSYCLMSNHIHILLEVPPMPSGGISDGELLQRLRAIHTEAAVAQVANELKEARDTGNANQVAEIHARFTYRMHDLSEFMKTLLQRFTRWFNRTHERRGTLWEERYKSVIVESGTAARTIAAYIDLNPVRAGMVTEPAEYRWSSYGEAVGGGKKGNGKKAREGLIQVYYADCLNPHDVKNWEETSREYRRLMGLSLERRSGRKITLRAKLQTKNTAEMLASSGNDTVLEELSMARLLRCRVRYFSDGAVIGTREFVNSVFEKTRYRFGKNRKDGARKLRGNASTAADVLWSLRDLQKSP